HHTAVAVLHRAGPVHDRLPGTRRDDEDGVLRRSDAPCRSATPHPRPRAPRPPPSRPLQPRRPHRPPAQRAGSVTHVSPRILGRGRPARGTMTPARVALGEKCVRRGKATLCIRMVNADATSGSTAWKIPAPVVFSVL